MTSIRGRKKIGVMMVIAYVSPSPMGGSEKQAMLLSEYLHRRHLDVRILALGKNGYPKRSKIRGVEIFFMYSVLNLAWGLVGKITGFLKIKRFGNRSDITNTKIEFNDIITRNDTLDTHINVLLLMQFFLFFINAFFFLFRRRRTFDIIHVHTFEWQAVVAVCLAKILNKKILVKDSTMNGVTNILRYPFGAWMQKIVINNAHFIAMTSVIENNFIKAGIRSDRIMKVPNGIELSSTVKRKPICNSCLFIGNLYQQPAKGIDILLRAWKMVNVHFPDARLDVVGEGDVDAYKEYCEANQIIQVYFHGKSEDVKEFMLNAEIFVLPSRREGMSNALIEAMSKELPCVATDISGNQDIIENMEDGILVPAGNANELAKGIYYLLGHKDDALRMGVNGRKKVENLLDINKIADKYIEIYYDI